MLRGARGVAQKSAVADRTGMAIAPGLKVADRPIEEGRNA